MTHGDFEAFEHIASLLTEYGSQTVLTNVEARLAARCIRACIEAAKEENDYEPHSAEYWQRILTGEPA